MRNSTGDDSSLSGNSDTSSKKQYGSWITTVPEPTADTTFIIMHSMNATNALFVISDILNLTCSQRPRTYCPTTLGPPSLLPTELQKTIPHHGYIDMIPFPILRDRILETLNVINEEELCRDLQSDDWKIWGKKPWEPGSWEFARDFVLKWWFLLDDDILRMTNFWRMQRQEEPLRLPHKQKLLEPSSDAGRIDPTL
jgi:Domain of unknown function (DUF3425)